MREIAVVTVGRSDFGIYLPLLKAIRSHPDLSLRILASGMHLSPDFGLTVNDIETAGFEVFERVESLVSSDTPVGIAKTIGLGVLGFAQLFGRYRPDMLVLLGDRFDMLPAALAALPFNIPIAHLHGGEATEGLIDEAIRHTLTKLSHLHFTSTEHYAQRVIQLGEEPWRVVASGALGVDAIREAKLDEPVEVARRFGLSLDVPTALVTYHPGHFSNVLRALGELGIQCVFTYPNADTAGRAIIQQIERFCAERANCRIVKNAGYQGYLSLMATVSVMVGNSSSGIIEAASFELPVVNVGPRQRGRLHAQNVLDCGDGFDEIVMTMRSALDPSFRARLSGLINPYGDGYAADRITERLSAVPLDKTLICKRFHELKPQGVQVIQ
jgi:GDP/UDP-N,N'-diacetylbacillosamine 2-epimerase (hydrolysing)